MCDNFPLAIYMTVSDAIVGHCRERVEVGREAARRSSRSRLERVQCLCRLPPAGLECVCAARFTSLLPPLCLKSVSAFEAGDSVLRLGITVCNTMNCGCLEGLLHKIQYHHRVHFFDSDKS